MIYRGLRVSSCFDSGVERKDEAGNPVICDGYFCQICVPDMGDYFDYFCAGVGYEIVDLSDEALHQYIKQYIDDNYEGLVETLYQLGYELITDYESDGDYVLDGDSSDNSLADDIFEHDEETDEWER